jgi:hypothetical protein
MMTEKYNFSENLDYYYILWMEACISQNEYKKILLKTDFMKKLFLESAFKSRAYVSIARAYYLNNDTWTASNIISEFETTAETDKLKYEYILLKAEIAEKQGRFSEALNNYNQIIQYYSQIGNNSIIF